MYRSKRNTQRLPFEPVSDNLYIDKLKGQSLCDSLEENKRMLKAIMSDSSDFVMREFVMEHGPKALVCYIDGLSDAKSVDHVIQSLMVWKGEYSELKQVKQRALPVSQLNEADNFGDLLRGVLSGDVGLLVDRQPSALLLGLRGPKHRSISEPETESTIRGPREGFNELLRTNTALLRRRIKSPRLKMKPMVIGKEANTDIVVAYIDGLANPTLVEEVIRRLENIDIDGVLESGYIEELIQDNGYSPFPQIQYTERPDTVAAALLEGRVAILTDGTPYVLLVPLTFWMMLQANEDYYERFLISSFLRLGRFMFLIIALTFPALYIAITTFHQEMIPTPLLLSVAAARESIPFPAVIEALIMEISFEALREAGVRLPKAVGQAVSILGALVVGQAAVQAGIVSAPMVIVVSITGIASFAIPKFNAAISVRLLRFPLMLIASIFGLFGIVIGLMFIIGHLAKMRSFGIPYLAPVSPYSSDDMRDTMVRMPWWSMKRRPEMFGLRNLVRLGKSVTETIAPEGGQTFESTDRNMNRTDRNGSPNQGDDDA